jgi:DNA polymerase
MASKVFGRHVDRKKNPDDYVYGFIGKCVVLGCGYGLGHMKFAAMINAGMLGGPSVQFDDKMVETLGADVEGYSRFIRGKKDLIDLLVELKPARLTDREWLTHTAGAFKVINVFRESNPRIPELWKTCDRMIDAMLHGREEKFGVLQTGKDFILLPNGMRLLYKGLERNEDGEYSYLRKKEGRIQRAKTYGGSILENCSQALAGAYVKEAMVRMHLRGYRPILQVHDEVVCIVPDSEAKEALRVVNECMTTVPSWAVGLPLASEGSYAKSYGEAK